MRRSSLPLLALCGMLSSCPHAEPRPAPLPTVRVVAVARRTMNEVVHAAGPLSPLPGADVKLGALVSGRVAEVLVAEGDRVAKGQVLVRIEATQFRDAQAQAQAQLEQARAQHQNDARKLERARQLLAAGIAARQEVDDATAQASTSEAAEKVAAAALSTARNQMNRTELRAPFDGVVARVFAAAGEPVDGSGKPILEVARTEVLDLRAALPPDAASRVHTGQQATLTVGGSGRAWGAEVVAVAPLLDATTGTATARLRVPNPDGFLKGGEVAQADLILATHAGVLAVPEAALVPAEQGGGSADSQAEAGGAGALAVEVVDAHGTAQRRGVKVGLRGDGFAEITAGVSEGERIISQGAYALPDGARVQIAEGAPVEAAAPR